MDREAKVSALTSSFDLPLRGQRSNFENVSNYVVFVLKLKLMKQGIDCRTQIFDWTFRKEVEVKRSKFSNIV